MLELSHDAGLSEEVWTRLVAGAGLQGLYGNPGSKKIFVVKSSGTKRIEKYPRLILTLTDRFLFLNKRQHQVTNVKIYSPMCFEFYMQLSISIHTERVGTDTNLVYKGSLESICVGIKVWRK